MSAITLHERLAPIGKLRIWLCIDRTQVAPENLAWKLNGATTKPEQIRKLRSYHKASTNLLTGLFEFSAAPHSSNVIEVKSGTESAKIFANNLPNEISADSWFRILLCSCYHQAEDRQALVSQSYLNIPVSERQDLSLFMGDQVYLDLPTLNNYPDDQAKLAERFQHYYRNNWTTYLGIDSLLKNAPAVFCPDDHEYWNNFPHRSPIVQNSWKTESQNRWKTAADDGYDAFQMTEPFQRGDCTEIDIDPLSIIILDQRSHRKADRSSALGPEGLKQLNDWVDRTIKDQKIGAVVTGQSLLDIPVSAFKGAIADWTLSNYGDFESVVKALDRLADAGRPVLLLTGDVHWGRVTKIRKNGQTRFIEIICSPLSLVTTVGSDQLRTIGAGFRKFFKGEKVRWPRHSSPSEAPAYFAQDVFGKRYRTETIGQQKGDQFAMLAFRKMASSLEAKVTFHEIHKHPQKPNTIDLGLLR